MIEISMLLLVLFSIPLGLLFGYLVGLIAREEISDDLWVYIIVKKVIFFSALLLSIYLVRKNFPKNSVIVGNPGKILRKNTKV